MSNLHRLQWIDSQIRNNRYPNTRTIAEFFEISPRQAGRDLEYLRYSMGAPLEYDAKHNGYTYTQSTFVLPAQLISDPEKEALSYLAHHYRNSSSAQAVKLAELFARLSDSGFAASSHPTAVLPLPKFEAAEPHMFEVLTHAISARRKVELTYQASSGEISHRLVAPYKLFIQKQIHYVAGFCELKQAIRVFRLSRIQAIKLTESLFEVVPFFKETDYVGTTPFQFQEPYQAVIRFAKPINPNSFQVPCAQITENTYQFKFYHSANLLANLLSQPHQFQILSPNWLKEKLREKLNRLLQANDN
ncbi:MAG TPA: WYL domain-containing protein [Bacillota bacterium]|nr:WYL domain-containing protein [Bacillota bacterium]